MKVFKSFTELGEYYNRPKIKAWVNAPEDVMNLWVDVGDYDNQDVAVYRNKRKTKVSWRPLVELVHANDRVKGKGKTLVRFPINRHFAEVLRYDSLGLRFEQAA